MTSLIFMRTLEKLANLLTYLAGHPVATLGSIFVILVWLLTGPLFHFSGLWQLAVNTGTTVVTFVLVFSIQHSSNVGDKAIHLKLDELLLNQKGARNDLAGAETLPEGELESLKE